MRLGKTQRSRQQSSRPVIAQLWFPRQTCGSTLALNVRFTPQALADLIDIHSYIATTDDAMADRIVSRIRQATLLVESYPFLGRQGSITDTREFPIPGLPYTIVYRLVSDTDLDILTFVHQRMRYPPIRM